MIVWSIVILYCWVSNGDSEFNSRRSEPMDESDRFHSGPVLSTLVTAAPFGSRVSIVKHRDSIQSQVSPQKVKDSAMNYLSETIPFISGDKGVTDPTTEAYNSTNFNTTSGYPVTSSYESKTTTTLAPFTATEISTKFLEPFIAIYNTTCIALATLNATITQYGSKPIAIPTPPEAEVYGTCGVSDEVINIIYPCLPINEVPPPMCDLQLHFSSASTTFLLSNIMLNITYYNETKYYRSKTNDVQADMGKSYRCTRQTSYSLFPSWEPNAESFTFTIHEIWVQAFRTSKFDVMGPVVDCGVIAHYEPAIPLPVIYVILGIVVGGIVLLACQKIVLKCRDCCNDRIYRRLRAQPAGEES